MWILLIVAILLLLIGLRESYTNYEEALKDVGQTAGYTSLTPKCPEGSSLNTERTKCKFTDTSKPDVTPTCSSDRLEFVGGTCKPKSGTTTATTIGTTATTTTTTTGTTGTSGTTGTTTATTTGTTTGGSSTSSLGPNSGGGGNRRNQVFGPGSGGMGEGEKVVPMDSSKTSQYPELMGGGDSKPSTRIDGGGIVPPSKNWQLAMNGSLPSSASLGTDENSKYLPYSRQPGDMELIPDPYRVSQQFSSASYSFKTEPSPFLTDFSAFLR
jgi:hypothetical protein